jgi:hypothetical protein
LLSGHIHCSPPFNVICPLISCLTFGVQSTFAVAVHYPVKRDGGEGKETIPQRHPPARIMFGRGLISALPQNSSSHPHLSSFRARIGRPFVVGRGGALSGDVWRFELGRGCGGALRRAGGGKVECVRWRRWVVSNRLNNSLD